MIHVLIGTYDQEVLYSKQQIFFLILFRGWVYELKNIIFYTVCLQNSWSESESKASGTGY